MRIVTAAMAAVLTMLLLLAGCSAISTGRITDKIYTAPYTTMHMQCISFSSKGICTGQMPVYTNHPERFRFNLDNGRETGWVYVNELLYNTYNVGDWYGEE